MSGEVSASVVGNSSQAFHLQRGEDRLGVGPERRCPRHALLLTGSCQQEIKPLRTWCHENGYGEMNCGAFDLSLNWVLAHGTSLFDAMICSGFPPISFVEGLVENEVSIPLIIRRPFPDLEGTRNDAPQYAARIIPMGFAALKESLHSIGVYGNVS